MHKDLFRSLSLTKSQLLQGSFLEEASKMEAFFDTVRMRVGEMQTQAKDAERRWSAAGIPWRDSMIKDCRLTSLHLASLFMSQ